MNFVGLIEHHARSLLCIAFALAVAGLVAAFILPVGLFPQVSFPRVVVDLSSGDRPADQTVLAVTRPVEEAIRSVPGVREVRSASSRGSAQISVDFGWGRDMIATTLLVDSAIAQALPKLPTGTTYGVRRMDPTVFPIISYALTSDQLTPNQLRDLAQYELVPLLAPVNGLARVDVQGGLIDEVHVEADTHKLNEYGIGMNELVAAVTAGNSLQAVGRVQDRDKLFLVVSNSNLRSIDELKNIVVRGDAAGVVHLSDVAEVGPGAAPFWLRVVEDGKPAVLFNVYEQPDGNAVQIAKDVRARLATYKLPAGVKLANWYDQSTLVLESGASVRDAVIIGLILAGIVLFVFLRNVRVMLIAVLVVPATLTITVLVLSVAGMSFNIMTLGGIAAAVGLVIDDMIVIVEHIARRAGAKGIEDGKAAVLPATREFLRPLTGSSLATLIVFLPLSFMSGVTGSFSKALAVTMAAALMISYLFAAFVVPVLARYFIDFKKWHDPAADRDDWLSRTHRRMLERAFAKPLILLGAIVPLLLVGALAYNNVQSGFMPKVDEGGFVMDFYTKPGTSLDETERELQQIEAILKEQPEVDTFSRRTGTGLGGDLGEPHHGDFFVRLKSDHERGTEEVMAAVLEDIQKNVPGVDIELAQLMEDLIGDLTAVPQPIEIQLYAEDPAKLIPQAKKVAAAIAKIPGVVEIKDGVMLAGDGIDMKVDPVKAAFEGVTPDEVSKAVDVAINGAIATQLPQPNKLIDVRVRMPRAMNLHLEDLADLPIRATDGHLFPLKRVATLTPVSGEPEIKRDNLQPMVAVTARIEGRGMGAAVADVEKVLVQKGMLASGVRYEMGGLYRQQQIAFASLAVVFIAALIAELVLLLILYEDFWLPLIIVGTSLLSTTGVFIALWITGVELNITALMGMTMVIGIATEMAIFYVSEYTELAHTMPLRQALFEASRNRLRPITMTTLAAILTLLPLAFAIGQGSGIQQPLAIAIIAGLVIQYPLVLLAMPVLIGIAQRGRGNRLAMTVG
ncbi:MAG: efflux RND transporter permease subunit [Proteobacteria bacterium]|uniref:efflux RND transporter permease subunit n=1 Tax=Rudaea sp. TaxID=2136325 RepID=UPI001D3E1557|nr:efflux RND transporter permease subunit [Pseudomonadota bacterium]MBS0567595.1 efflux RND transporter permease subunit [Pseudomonadota bacterium]